MSNKRAANLTVAAFCAVVVLCLAGVGTGAWLLASAPEEAPVTVTTPVIAGTADLSDETPITAEPVTTPVEIEPSAETGTAASIPDSGQAAPEPPPAVEVIAPPATGEEAPVEAEPPVPVSLPVDGEVVAVFSVDMLTYSATLGDWRTHDGIDLAAAIGTPVTAAAAGTVADLRDDPLLGTTVVLQHSGGVRTVYAGLEADVPVRFGQTVEAGQQVGTVGDSAAAEAAEGPHLHFSVSRDGQPVDPVEYLKQ